MKFIKNGLIIPLIGVILGFLFALWDSFCDYLDATPIGEELLILYGIVLQFKICLK